MFEKYYDAVGNLRREVKFIDGEPNIESNSTGSLITDYRYDSSYRVSKVKTPEGKSFIIIMTDTEGSHRESLLMQDLLHTFMIRMIILFFHRMQIKKRLINLNILSEIMTD
ncbi:MAG: RHS repeat protein [Ignavibacteria bacterium]|nr:RHS repeat protein [Ignavibacteria bacterium]